VAEAIIYGPPAPGREYAHGLEHALLRAENRYIRATRARREEESVVGDAVEHSMEAPEVLPGGDVAGEGDRCRGGAGVVLGRCGREGEVSGGDAF
jgi:hypothetical protein